MKSAYYKQIFRACTCNRVMDPDNSATSPMLDAQRRL